jgi:hypothetical protein
MPRKRHRPKGLPWTHAIEPTEASAFRDGMESAASGNRLAPILALDRHAWRGVLHVVGAPASITGALAGQWADYCRHVCWFGQVNQDLVLERINDLATPAAVLIASSIQPPAAKAKDPDPPAGAAIPPPWLLPAAKNEAPQG